VDEELARARAAIRAALQRGEYLIAYDEAKAAAEAFPDDVQVRYDAVLALARAGASDRAAEELEAAGLAGDLPDGLPPRLAEDVAALGARLAKDRATALSGPRRADLAREAAERYEAIFRWSGRSYSCINAATMWLLAGNEARSTALAADARRAVEADVEAGDEDSAYWTAATQAEVSLLLGELDEAADWLRTAAQESPGDFAARASTRRQLGMICRRRGVDESLLDALPVPGVVHYCGHRLDPTGARFAAAEVPRVTAEACAFLDERDVGFAYGSLASGGDLLVAEEVLRRGAELHAFLPFPAEEFVATSVADAGPAWVQRFERCLEGATSVTTLDDGPYLGDDVLFTCCSHVAMGHALIRAEHLTARAAQLAVWDGTAGNGVGTAADVAAWRDGGGETVVVAPGGSSAPSGPGGGARVLRAMLFADFKGFSALHDRQMVAFVDVALGPVARVLDRYDEHIVIRRTWGDGLHIAFRDVRAAACCALDLQDLVRDLDWVALGFPHRLGLRIGAHAGPVSEVIDPVQGAVDCTGVHIVRTARIEPRTPVGDVYVTDPFAALLTMAHDPELSCQYVGHVPTAKDYGTFPMYVLRRVQR
jgi:tetratricopeptide (TPR) repeat protein